MDATVGGDVEPEGEYMAMAWGEFTGDALPDVAVAVIPDVSAFPTDDILVHLVHGPLQDTELPDEADETIAVSYGANTKYKPAAGADVTGDGFGDLVVGGHLFRGPVTDAYGPDDADVVFEPKSQYSFIEMGDDVDVNR